ncbi:Cwf15/Cwc15 cell cycle control protein [Cordyceps fumosorosea ARSEF 2679]|uniref:Cwf15/Cwc15 cell cycle control protein n=1 Tax=Cordyceps fumosorosea (strain ARSEF 2679) TaxID=1081104 RepID=A0A162MAL5_CORFA|nr:Cwf15/Cwc15 cell cycle control protein [Cordyceps fumosorosea ARSEF 2679]OAA53410.1 Cwf15/Cwc15 cell cycle control protein [Cordyceps fumosorosea ARSEF 2679]
MTTAHRPTFDPARGKDALRGPAYHQRLLPAHTQLKYRRAGQGGAADDGDDDDSSHDLATQLLAAEAAHFAKKKGTGAPLAIEDGEKTAAGDAAAKRSLPASGEAEEEDMHAKRRRILEETRDIDADDSDEEEDDDDDSDDSDDEDAELQRELERVRREREEKKKQEELARVKEEEDARERNIALGNPLLNKQDFTMKRRWDDDVVFKNQARGTEDKGKNKGFVNDALRSDFHRRFMSKYVR